MTDGRTVRDIAAEETAGRVDTGPDQLTFSAVSSMTNDV